MKTLFLVLSLLVSASCFAAAPRAVHLDGTMTFKSDGVAVPLSIELGLKRERATKLRYEGKLVYIVKNKTYRTNVQLEMDLTKNTTWVQFYLGSTNLSATGSSTAMNPGNALSLEMKQYENIPERCYGRERNRCTGGYMNLIDTGVLVASITDAE